MTTTQRNEEKKNSNKKRNKKIRTHCTDCKTRFSSYPIANIVFDSSLLWFIYLVYYFFSIRNWVSKSSYRNAFNDTNSQISNEHFGFRFDAEKNFIRLRLKYPWCINSIELHHFMHSKIGFVRFNMAVVHVSHCRQFTLCNRRWQRIFCQNQSIFVFFVFILIFCGWHGNYALCICMHWCRV